MTNRLDTGNERGMALIVVLIMLLLLTILGASVLSSTVSDLRITGNSRSSIDVFFAADAALEYAQSNSEIYSNMISQGNLKATWPGPVAGQKYPGYAPVAVGNLNAHVKVDYLSTGPVPPDMGTETDSGLGSGSGFVANYYAVSVVGNGSNDESRAEIEAQVIKLAPK